LPESLSEWPRQRNLPEYVLVVFHHQNAIRQGNRFFDMVSYEDDRKPAL
jgi:hypothetical protein